MIYRPRSGFIALFSVLTLSAVLLAGVAVADYAAYVGHEAVTEERSYRNAQEAALSCARFALSRLDADPLRFSGSGTTSIQLSDISFCAIAAASSTADVAGAYVSGISDKSFVSLYVNGTRASSTALFKISSWTEY